MEKVQIAPKTISLAVFLVLGLLLAYFARYLVLTTLIGIGLGTIIAPTLNKSLKRYKIPKAISGLLVLFFIVLIVLGVGAGIFAILSDQLNSLLERSPEIYSRLESWSTSLFSEYPWIEEQLRKLNLASSVRSSLFNVFKGFQVGVIALSGAVYAVVIGLYTAVNSQEYFNSLVEAFPQRHREEAKTVIAQCGRVLRNWFKAQMLDMVLIGSITAFGLWLLGVDYWAVFGLMTSLFGIIPYVGMILVVTLTSLITLTSDPGLVPWVLVVFIITQQLEGNVILPLVMRGRAELPEVPLLIFMLFMGAFFGLLGFFVAPALFSVLRSLYIHLYLPRMNKLVR